MPELILLQNMDSLFFFIVNSVILLSKQDNAGPNSYEANTKGLEQKEEKERKTLSQRQGVLDT